MATIVRQSNNRKLLQFIGPHGKRKSIRLGSINMKQASTFKIRIEHLIDSVRLNQLLNNDTSLWVNGLDSAMFDKLANAGLISHRTETALDSFVEDYIKYKDIKESTKTIYRLVQNNLNDYFGKNKELKDITSANAEKWQIHLRGTGLSDNTVNKRTKIAKQFFASAIKAKIISENPFCGLKTNFQPAEEKMHFITRDAIYKIIKQSSDPKTRLIVALARFGGMRCISEPLALKWNDIDWKNKKIMVTNVKTESTTGKATRTMPLFPELVPFLKAVQKDAGPDDIYIFTGQEDLSFTHASVRSRVHKMTKRAGFEIWGKLFINLRSSRETELVQQFPLHVVCAWLGNSEIIAQKHYLQVTDEDFKLAAKGKSSLGPAA